MSCAVGPVEEVVIAISALHHAAMFVADALYHDSLSILVASDVERTDGPHCHPTDVDASELAP